MKIPAINRWDRFIIKAWRESPEKFNGKPLSVTRYELAYAWRDFKKALIKAWPFKLIFR